MQFNVLDYIIAVLVVLALFKGLRQGLLGALSGIAGIIIGFILAVCFSHDLAALMDSYFGLTKFVTAWLEDALPLTALAPGPAAKLPGLDSVYQQTSTFLAANILEILSFLILIIAGSLAVHWLGKGLSRLLSGTIFSHFNRVLGAILEVTKVVLVLIILLGLLSPSLELGTRMGLPAAKMICGYIDHSVISGYLKDIFVLFKDGINLNA